MKTAGMYTRHIGKSRVQLYWPEVTLSKAEVFLGVDTVARYINRPEQHYFGAGFKVLGLGLGFDYYYPPAPNSNGGL